MIGTKVIQYSILRTVHISLGAEWLPTYRILICKIYNPTTRATVTVNTETWGSSKTWDSMAMIGTMQCVLSKQVMPVKKNERHRYRTLQVTYGKG